ncbi:MAG: hypothetical protein V7K96_11355 [Nostoc sp.]
MLSKIDGSQSDRLRRAVRSSLLALNFIGDACGGKLRSTSCIKDNRLPCPSTV